MSINNAIEIIVNEGMKKSNKPPKKPRASKTKHVVKAVVTEKVKDACSDPNSPLDKQYLQHWKKTKNEWDSDKC
ncbi:hypothetical protein QTN25_003171 [Entamoeba marina]